MNKISATRLNAIIFGSEVGHYMLGESREFFYRKTLRVEKDKVVRRWLQMILKSSNVEQFNKKYLEEGLDV